MKRDPNNEKPDQPNGKYYVHSNQVKWVFVTKDPECAALRLVQKTAEPAVKSKQKITSGMKMIDPVELERLVQSLGPEILVSESGFDSKEAGVFATDNIIHCWLNQMTAIEKLLRKLA